MIRDISKILVEWKKDENRRPLLIRGARQTGKTFIVTELGKTEFEDFIYINFERNPEYMEIFSVLNPQEINVRIGLFLGKTPRENKTLLFLDEIQECPNAIMALRYYYEELPKLHIIGAGSLLEFALSSKGLKMPVGRIQYLHLHPLSFGEFLTALGEHNLRTFIADLSNLGSLPEALHNKLIALLIKYYILGGMPAVIQEYITSSDVVKCKRIQQSLLDTYSDDFAKYATASKQKYLKKVFQVVPKLVGQKFVYAQVDRAVKSRDLKEALELLEMAGIVSRVKQTSGAGVPLSSGENDKFFKIIFLDIGLFHTLYELNVQDYLSADLTAAFKGSAAEQFAGQEFIAHQSPYSRKGLYYWTRTEKNSQAEIDYLLDKDGQVIPIEIKSSSIGHLKSLLQFIKKYNSKRALKISQAPYKESDPILSIPLYAIEAWFKSHVKG